MTIYVLQEWDYEDHCVLGAYSSLELAKAQVPGAEWAEQPGHYGRWCCGKIIIVEIVLDEPVGITEQAT